MEKQLLTAPYYYFLSCLVIIQTSVKTVGSMGQNTMLSIFYYIGFDQNCW